LDVQPVVYEGSGLQEKAGLFHSGQWYCENLCQNSRLGVVKAGLDVLTAELDVLTVELENMTAELEGRFAEPEGMTPEPEGMSAEPGKAAHLGQGGSLCACFVSSTDPW
jgi:hypothetical protein